MTIGKQLTFLIAGFALALPVGTVALSLYQYRAQQETRTLTADGNRRTNELFAALRSVAKAQAIVQQVVREKDPDRLESLLDDGKKLMAEAGVKIQSLRSGRTPIVEAFESLQQADEKCIGVLLRGEFAQAQQHTIEEANPAFDAVLAAMGTFQQQSANEAAVITEAAYQASSRGQTALFLIGGVFIATLSVFGMLVVRRINRSFRTAVAELFAASRETGKAAAALLSASNQQAQGASGQAATIQETSAASEQINSMAIRNGESSRKAAELVEHSQERFADAGRALDGMVGSIEEIHKASQGVAKIMKVVDEIAFQTNILALNAAVEAARAGAAGAGFSVVADEVRSLAQRCAQAAKDTATLTEQSLSLSSDGQRKVAHVVEAMSLIRSQAGEVAALVSQVNQGSNEQAGGTTQIARALADMQQVTQRNAATAEESAAAARQLDSQAHALDGIVQHMAALVGRDAA